MSLSLSHWYGQVWYLIVSFPDLCTLTYFNKLVFLFKIAGGMVPAINSEDYLKPQLEKRRIKAKQFSDYQCSNIVDNNVTNNSRCFIVNNFRTDQFRHSSFIDGVIKWNHLPDGIKTTCQQNTFVDTFFRQLVDRS